MFAKLRGCIQARKYITGRSPLELVVKGYRLLRREGLAGLRRIYLNVLDISYIEWINRYDTLSTDDRRAIRRHIETLQYRPTISVLMPVFNPPPDFLSRAINSVREQLYPDWELCIVDDASTAPHVRPILEAAAKDDPRIRVLIRATNGHISAATNDALYMACGEFIALLDHDDELTEHALYHVAVALNVNCELDLLYSDEDKIDVNEHRFGHYFKPDWNPDLFLSQNLICHLGVYRRAIAIAIAGFREGYEGSQDWDFALRFVEGIPSEHIFHIPRILYHWRAIPGSTAVTVGAKEYAVAAAQRALLDYWHRRGNAVTVNPIEIEAGHFITHCVLPVDIPLVSIIICTRNRKELLQQCVEGIGKCTSYSRCEIIIVDNGSDEDATLSYLAELHDSGKARVVQHSVPFNFSELNNFAARYAQGSMLCLMNNDVVPMRPGWLDEMVAHALRPEVGAVGAKLYYPNGKIQHAGIILDGVAARHLHLGYPGGASGYGNRARLAQNFSAVTAACLVISKSIWDEVGGMDEAFAVAFNDVDFCLRVQERGYHNLWLPQAELYHYESASRGPEDTLEKQARFAAEVALLRQRWRDKIAADPAWNPNLDYNGVRIGLALPPRTVNPWREFDV